MVLVTSTKKSKWVIPKGIVEDGLAPADSALKEALEEAGVVGKVTPQPAGVYSYKKWGGTCTVEVFPMLIEEVLESWPESHIRERTFVTPEEACRLLNDRELTGIIERYFRIGG